MTLRILVTGGTGFVGGHLVPGLIERGHEVTCLVRDEARATDLRDRGARLVAGDVTEPRTLPPAVRNQDQVVNLANVYTLWEADTDVYYRVNVEGTRNLLEAAMEAAVEKVVHVSSAVTYGRPQEHPFTETCVQGPERFSEYAESKYQGDEVAWRLHREQGLPLVALYPGAIVGPGDTKTTGTYLANLLERRVPGRVCGSSRMTYVYVGDVAEAIIQAAERPETTGRGYLVGGHTLSMNEFTDLICAAGGVRPPRHSLPTPVVAAGARLLTAASRLTGRAPMLGLSVDQVCTIRNGFCFDGSKAVRELGITYHPIERAIEEAVEAYLGQRGR